MNKLTRRQEDILSAIKGYIEENGYSPSYRDISGLVGISSVSTVCTHLDKLKRKGYINFAPGQPRTISIIA